MPMRDQLTKEQLEFIRERYPTTGAKALIDEFNATFNLNRKPQYLNTIASKYGIRMEKEAYKAVYKGIGEVPIGTVSKNAHNGRYYVKVRTDRRSSANWQEAGKYMWEKHNGPVPKGSVVIFLDNNPEHWDDINNLMCITQKQARQLMAAGYRSEDPEITKTGLLLFELRDTIGISSDDFRQYTRKYDRKIWNMLKELED